MIDSGPTEAMINAGFDYEGSDMRDADPYGWFTAMLKAALEEKP
jgi:hypothetical protein